MKIALLCLSLATFLGATGGVCEAQAAPDPLAVPEVTVDSSAILASVLLDRIKKGETTAEAAWESGELDEAMLLFLLDQPSGYRSGESLLDKAKQNEAFVGVLLKHLPERVGAQNMAKLGEGARYRVASYWFKRKDDRATPLLQELVEEGEVQFAERKRLPWFYELSVTLLGEWYQANGQESQGLKLLDGAALLSKNAAFRADWLLLSARMANVMGEQDRARNYYEQIAQFGHGWFSALAIYDQARALMAQGKHSEARALLQPAATSLEAEPSRVVGLSLLGYSYYLTGELEESRDFARQSMALYQSLSGKTEGKGLEGSLRRAFQILSLTQPKVVDPMVAQPRELHFVADSNAFFDGPEKVVTRRLVVRVLQPVTLTIGSDMPAMTVELGDHWKPVVGSNWIEKEVIVQVNLNLLPSKKGATQGTLKISSAQISDFQKQVPVFIELR